MRTLTTCLLLLPLALLAPAQAVSPGIETFDGATASTTAECGTNDPGVLPAGWSNDPTGSTVWRVRQGGTPSGGTGPAGDHTTGNGNYVYVETSCGSGYWFGTLESPLFDAAGLQYPTLTFWYHMYGVAMGSLAVQQRDAQGSWFTIHTISGDQGFAWKLAVVPIQPVQGTVALRFFYVRGSAFQSDCCLDDIAFGEPSTGGNCVTPGIEDFESATPPANSTCTTNLAGSLPTGWEHVEGNAIDWRAWVGPTPSANTGPSTNHSQNQSATGTYAYVEVSGCSPGEIAALQSPCWDATTLTTPSLEFWYHLYGASAGRLDVQELRADGTWDTLWSRSGDQGDQWRFGATLLTPVGGVCVVRFRYERGESFDGDCAIDDVTFGEPSPGPWQVNQPGASFDIEGEVGHTIFPCTVQRCGLSLLDLNFASTLSGSPWDLGITAGLSLPPGIGGSTTPGGQIINLNLASPSLSWFNGGPVASLSTPFPGTQTVVAQTPPAPTLLSAQMFVLDSSHPDGFVLSQAPRLVVLNQTTVPGPTVDEEVLTVTTQGLPLCGPAMIPFYGTLHSVVNVHSNGRVSFGAGAAVDFSASPDEAASGPPFIGFWTDLDPTTGSIDISAPNHNTLRVDWNGVPYFGETETVSFSITLDAGSGAIHLGGLSGIVPNSQGVGLPTAGDRQFLGISPGLVGAATDPGSTSFGVGATGSVGPTSMLYDWYDHLSGGPALVPSLLGGLDTLAITPRAGGGYDWSGF